MHKRCVIMKSEIELIDGEAALAKLRKNYYEAI